MHCHAIDVQFLQRSFLQTFYWIYGPHSTPSLMSTAEEGLRWGFDWLAQVRVNPHCDWPFTDPEARESNSAKGCECKNTWISDGCAAELSKRKGLGMVVANTFPSSMRMCSMQKLAQWLVSWPQLQRSSSSQAENAKDLFHPFSFPPPVRRLGFCLRALPQELVPASWVQPSKNRKLKLFFASFLYLHCPTESN